MSANIGKQVDCGNLLANQCGLIRAEARSNCAGLSAPVCFVLDGGGVDSIGSGRSSVALASTSNGGVGGPTCTDVVTVGPGGGGPAALRILGCPIKKVLPRANKPNELLFRTLKSLLVIITYTLARILV